VGRKMSRAEKDARLRQKYKGTAKASAHILRSNSFYKDRRDIGRAETNQYHHLDSETLWGDGSC